MYYAELDTDRYIRETFFPDMSYIGTMVEVGAGPPDTYSISKHFREHGWRCICVEPNPDFVNQHKQQNNEIYQYACADYNGNSTFTIVKAGVNEHNSGMSYSSLEVPRYAGTKSFNKEIIDVQVITLNSLLEKIQVTELDFVSVDTEGWEIDVMRGFDLVKYKPTVILLENFTLDYNYVDYMISVGYTLHKKLDYNYIFSM